MFYIKYCQQIPSNNRVPWGEVLVVGMEKKNSIPEHNCQ